LLGQDHSLAGPSSHYHLINHFDPINPISATVYANEARSKIKDILSRNKTPIVEGGSPFYIHQIFNPNLTNYNDDTFKEAR
jgi:tRNA A37 N6-isopentenylltransferase MiaA